MEEQISIFDLLEKKMTKAVPAVKPADKKKAAKKKASSKPEMPAILKGVTSLPELMKRFGYETISVRYMTGAGYAGWREERDYYRIVDNKLIRTDAVPPDQDLNILDTSLRYYRGPEICLKYIDENGHGWHTYIGIRKSCHYIGGGYEEKYVVSGGKWQLTNKILGKGVFLKGSLTPGETLNEYQRAFAADTLVNEEFFAEAPWVETLYKAGYRFAKDLVESQRYPVHYVDEINRLCQPGTKPAKIFKTDSVIYKTLKDERDLEKWDRFRVLKKKDRISDDTAVQCIEHNFDKNELRLINTILGQEYAGKKVFSFDSLINYLGRLDQFEAIEEQEALQLLADYLNMCRLLEMRPRVDGDSLKREHDIAARLVRSKRNEILAKQMKAGCEKLQAFNYENDQFLVRGIRDYDDLLDEAKQQHNCVASYASHIASGRSLIYVLRRKSSPKRSLVTIELSPGPNYTVRQKLMAFNRPIYDSAITEFINEWVRWIKTKKK